MKVTQHWAQFNFSHHFVNFQLGKSAPQDMQCPQTASTCRHNGTVYHSTLFPQLAGRPRLHIPTGGRRRHWTSNFSKGEFSRIL